MHYLIRVITYADDKVSALNKAKSILDGLCGDGKEFDYYTTFDDKSSSVSGPARWGKLPVAALAASKVGKKLIDDGMRFTKEEFIEKIKKAREFLKSYADDELFEEEIMNDKSKVIQRLDDSIPKDLYMFKYYMYSAGRYRGPGIYIYSHEGEGINKSRQLSDELSRWEKLYSEKGKTNPDRFLKVWVVPADVHG